MPEITNAVFILDTFANYQAGGAPGDLRDLGTSQTIGGIGDPAAPTPQDPTLIELSLGSLTPSTQYAYQVIGEIDGGPGEDVGQVLFFQTTPDDETSLEEDDVVATVNASPNPPTNPSATEWGILGAYSAGTVNGDELDEFRLIIQPVAGAPPLTLVGEPGVTESPNQVPNENGAFTYFFPGLTPGATYNAQAVGWHDRGGPNEWLSEGAVIQFTVAPATTQDGSVVTVQARAFEGGDPETEGSLTGQRVDAQQGGTNVGTGGFLYVIESAWNGGADLRNDPGATTVEAASQSPATPPGSFSHVLTGLVPGGRYLVQAGGAYDLDPITSSSDIDTVGNLLVLQLASGGTTFPQDDQVTVQQEYNNQGSDQNPGTFRMSGTATAGTIHGDELEFMQLVAAPVPENPNPPADLRTANGALIKAPEAINYNATTSTYNSPTQTFSISGDGTEPGVQYWGQAVAYRSSDQEWVALGNIILIQAPPNQESAVTASWAPNGAGDPSTGGAFTGLRLVPNDRSSDDLDSFGYVLLEDPGAPPLTTDLRTAGGTEVITRPPGPVPDENDLYSETVTGLTPATTYYIQAIGKRTLGLNQYESLGEVLAMTTTATPGSTVAEDDQIYTVPNEPSSNTATTMVANGLWDQGTVHGDELEQGFLVLASEEDWLDEGSPGDLRTIVGASKQTSPDESLAVGATPNGDIFGHAFTGLEPATRYVFQAFGRRDTDQQWEASGNIVVATTSAADPRDVPVATSAVSDVGSGGTEATLTGLTLGNPVATGPLDATNAVWIVVEASEFNGEGDLRDLNAAPSYQEFTFGDPPASDEGTFDTVATGLTPDTGYVAQLVYDEFGDEASPGESSDDELSNILAFTSSSTTQAEDDVIQHHANAGRPEGAPANEQGAWFKPSDGGDANFITGVYNEGTVHGDELENAEFWFAPFTGQSLAGIDVRSEPGAIQATTSTDIPGDAGIISGQVDDADIDAGESYVTQIIGTRTSDQAWELLSNALVVTVVDGTPTLEDEDIETLPATPTGSPSTTWTLRAIITAE